jgi:hypothetical protein
MMKHIRQHFRGNIAEEVDIRDEEFMDIVVDSFPGEILFLVAVERGREAYGDMLR